MSAGDVIGRTVFTAGQVAQICGTSVRTARKWFERRLLPAYRIPGSLHWRVRRGDLAAFMAAHGIPSSAPDVFCPPGPPGPPETEKAA
jgi:excisionase family DNA binding protein